MMAIVTFTTDYGTRDYYSGSLKGVLLSENADLQFIDITHNIKSYDIVQAAFILKNAYPGFPKGTIHIASVHNHQEQGNWLLGLSLDGHHFIGPDNGLFTLMFGRELDLFKLPFDPDQERAYAKSIATAVAALARGAAFPQIGNKMDDYVQRIHFQPIVTQDQIRATVIHIDHFGNAIFNISREQFEKFAQGRPFELFYKRHDPIRQFKQRYADAAVGEVLCFFNDAGYLELAINTGRADSMLGLKLDDTIHIRFFNSNE